MKQCFAILRQSRVSAREAGPRLKPTAADVDWCSLDSPECAPLPPHPARSGAALTPSARDDASTPSMVDSFPALAQFDVGFNGMQTQEIHVATPSPPQGKLKLFQSEASEM